MKSAGYILVVLFATLALASAEIKNRGWWKHMVFYQIYPKSFKDSNGDGYGDLKGITSKLQHFKDLGVGGIWLSPINKSPQVDNGYDISDFREIEPTFGTMKDLEELIEAAHKQDLKVILDLVPNHTSDEHDWFKLSQNRTKGYEDYYMWYDCKREGNETIPPNNWVSVFNGSGWTWNEERKQCYYHQFYPKQPDLNYNNPKVKEEMKDIMTFWLDKGFDGFRIDAVPHIIEGDISTNEALFRPDADTTLHASYNHTITKDQPGTYDIIMSWRGHVDEYATKHNRSEIVLMTEAYTSLDNTLKYYYYGSNIPFNFKYITNANANSDAKKFKEIADDWIKNMPNEGIANWVMGNHDRNRLPTRYPGREDQMIMLEMILPGVAVTYYGEEIGMEDYIGNQARATDFRDGCRTPMQWDNSTLAGFTNGNTTWLPVNPKYDKVNVEAQKSAEKSHLKLYMDLIKLRQSSVLKDGIVKTSVLNNEVLVVKRYLPTDTVALLINFNSQNNVTVNVTDVMGSSESRVRLTDTNTNMKLNSIVRSSEVVIPAKASIVLEASGGAPSSASTIGFSVVSILLIAIVSLFQS